MRILVKVLGGSVSYGLNTPSSDEDIRYLFCHTEASKIVGLERYDHQDSRGEGEDKFGWELRHFLNHLRKTNTAVMEILWNDAPLETTPEWQYIQSHRLSLIDSDRLFVSLLGYMHGERGLTLGDSRRGKLGGKRREALDFHGFSPKNLVNFIRLGFQGGILFKKGYFPVNLTNENKDFRDFLYEIKVNPGSINREQAIQLMDEAEERLKRDYDNKQFNYSFNFKLANDIVFDIYYKELSKIAKERLFDLPV